MKVRQLPPLLDGERILAMAPKLAPKVASAWNRRLHFHTGRSLGHRALSAEQDHRAGRLAALGQLLTPGIVVGLEVALEFEPVPGGTIAWAHIAPGIGLTRTGEDVVLPRPIRTQLAFVRSLPGEQPPFEAPYPSPAYVLLLQPATVEQIAEFDPSSQCEIDPDAFPYEDHQRVDAARLVRFPWPEEELGPVGAAHQRRNRLAWIIFEAERRGVPLPWAGYGVPLALIASDDGFRTAEATYTDRGAVARRGGIPAPKRPIFSVLNPGDVLSVDMARPGLPLLWQARFEQLLEHLSDLEPEPIRLNGLASVFRWLPPVGVLPPGSVDVRGENPNDPFLFALDAGEIDFLPEDGIFPPQFLIEAAPMRLEAFDEVMDGAAMLSRIDLQRNEHVQVLVPVPEAWFDPRLLVIERVDAAFDAAIALYWWRENDRRARRDAVFDDAKKIRLVLTGEDLESAEDPGIPALPEGWPVLNLPPAADDESVPAHLRQDPISDEDDTFAADLEALKTALNVQAKQLLPDTPDTPNKSERRHLLYHGIMGTNPSGVDAQDYHETELFDVPFTGGLGGFIKTLEEKITEGSEQLEAGHYRVRTELFRLRQMLVQNETATRLATSPVLGSLAEKIEEPPTSAKLNRLGNYIKTGGVVNPPPPPPPPSTAFGGRLFLAAVGPAVNPPAARAALPGAALPGAALPGAALPGAALPGAALPGAALPGAALPGAALPGAALPGAALPGRLPAFAEARAATSMTVHFNAPLSVRLKSSTSVEARTTTLDIKAEIFQLAMSLEELGISLEGIQFRGVANPDDLQDNKVTRNAGESDDDFRIREAAELAIRRSANLGFLRRGIIFNRNTLAIRISVLGALQQQSDKFDPLDTSDESGFFAAAIRSLEHAASWLRSIEARLQNYQQLAKAARETYLQIQALGDRVERRLETLGDLIAEIRHDLDVAWSLRNEEWARLTAINTRRRQIIADHVPYLVFRRPRTLETLSAPPSRPFDRAEIEDPLPDCLRGDFEAPDALRAMIDLIREAPVGWLSHMPKLVKKLNKLDAIRTLLSHAKSRADAPLRPLWQPLSAAVLSDKLGKQMRVFHGAQRAVLAQARAPARTLQVSKIATWTDARRKAETVTTVSDLIDARHGRADVARQASAEMENIYRVAACLYVRFREIPAVDRLRWVDDISSFDDAVDLRDLSRLERWGQVLDRYERQEMQRLVDWLHGRMTRSESKAVALMNEVIRVALLLASHAPVHALIRGELVEPRRIALGGLVRIRVDVTRVRVGMLTTLFDNNRRAVGRGLVKDLHSGSASIEVMRVEAAEPMAYTARFIEPDRGARGTLGLLK